MLGGEACWKKHTSRGFGVFFEWFEGEPTVFFTRANRFALSGNRESAAIALPKAHEYAHSKTGAPTPRAMIFAAQACERLGLEPSRGNVYAMLETIMDALPELLKMPPEPSHHALTGKNEKPVGEASIIVDGQTVLESEIH